MKPMVRSKTIWTGIGITLMSILTVLVAVWDLLDPDQMALLDGLFGPTTTAIIGVIMIVLRVITTQPLGRNTDYNAAYEVDETHR